LLCSIILCFSIVSSVQTCFAQENGAIYIRADGSIDPPTAPISTLDNITYTLTGNIINNSIVIENDNVVVDGAGYIVEGTGYFWTVTNKYGILLVQRTDVTIKNVTINGFITGIYLEYSSNNIIAGNSITTSQDVPGYGIGLSSSSSNSILENNMKNNKGGGITLYDSSYNSISRNNITENGFGIDLEPQSVNNTFSRNHITNNVRGIFIDSSSNTFYHNNFINNSIQVSSLSFANFWDNGLEGNYWSDYNGTDSNQDGIGDTLYIIDANNTDHYPLTGTFQSFDIFITPQSFEEVYVISNFTISDLGLREWLTTPTQYIQAGQSYLSLTLAEGQILGTGFCRMTLPNNILNTSDYLVLVNMTPISANRLAISNDTYTTLYFSFNSSASSPFQEVILVPELPSLLFQPLLILATLLVMIVFRRRHLTRAV
jgi:parallel beta-helix repeat protein